MIVVLQTIDCIMIGISVTVNNFICISSISDEELEDKYEIKKIDYTEISIGIQRTEKDKTKNVIGSDIYGEDISGNVIVFSSDYQSMFRDLLEKYKFAYK
jgi:hypothetical protein